jgi:protein SCO1/2
MRSGPAVQAPRRVALALAALLTLSACGPASSTSLTAQGLSRGSDGWYGLPLSVQRSLPDVTLLTTAGVPFALSEELIGTPTLLFFGYSSCPDICPIHLAAITNAMEQTRTGHDRIQVVFVSVDPERDTPERIEEFLDYFSSRIIGLHGDLDDVADALSQLDLPGPIVEGPDPRGEGVLIGHPAQVIGFDAAGNARRVWPFGTRRADWVSDIPRIAREWA